MAQKALAVYISTTPDLAEYRHLIIEACQAMGMQTLMPALPSSLLDEADIYLGIIGREYGPLVESDDILLIEMEYNLATQYGIPCFIFMMEEAA